MNKKLSFRGDAHKFYLKLKRQIDSGEDPRLLRELKEIREIRDFYSSLNVSTLKNIKFRILKEKSGSGVIPILVTAIPWGFFIFGKKIQDVLANDSYIWIILICIYIIAVSLSVIIHFRERAWASVHLQIIEDTIEFKNGTP
ncbi:hypothetical protein J2S74_003090 [Evansella vedderi]|uniref:Uncharacterized protein n=1 Tax=Evansella vedderi TaxID=38282 RepID=A0ABT9ZWU4_9BACI|nr:hypothetical protein [Evansella vedderi]MDQ0255708.1 hypothetical protein [Evansella vedderi]